MPFRLLSFLLLALLLSSCASYYQRNSAFMNHLGKGDYKKAEKEYASDKKMEKRKARFLYFTNLGLVNHLQGDYDTSNYYFEKAYRMIEDEKDKLVAEQAAALVTNPRLITYRGEDHEILFINYYMALNYLYLNNHEAALVEVRRMRIRLNEQNDRYKGKANRYDDDAFINLLSGLIYDAQNDYNNAFIAYRNAFNVYENYYTEYFGIGAPLQLKKDLLRTAKLTGLDSEYDFYKRKFNFEWDRAEISGKGSLVFLWHNGLGPIKDEQSINFTIIEGDNASWVFFNDEYGLSFPVYVGGGNNGNSSDFSDLQFIRLALPKYIQRPPLFTSANIEAAGETYELEIAEDINAIALKVLQDRMLRELGNALLRLATKKSAELALREENEDAGAALGIINALTEQADIRNWTSLPFSIHYTRAYLNPDTDVVTLNVSGNEAKSEFTVPTKIKSGRTTFQTFRNLETRSSGQYIDDFWLN